MKHTLESIGKLINRGEWVKAYDASCDSSFEFQHRKEAGYWLQRSLIEFLCVLPEDAEESMEAARKCPNFKHSMEGDFLRDRGLYLLHQGKHDEAEQDFAAANPFHEGEDRQNVLQMCRARLEVARGDLEQACEFFSDANSSWLFLIDRGEPYTPQWIMNNRFHWFYAKHARGEVDEVMAKTIIKTDPSPVRRFRALLILRGGGRGARLEHWVARRHGR